MSMHDAQHENESIGYGAGHMDFPNNPTFFAFCRTAPDKIAVTTTVITTTVITTTAISNLVEPAGIVRCRETP